MIQKFFLLIPLVLFFVMCSKNSPVEPPVVTRGSIYGTVIDSVTQLPLIGAIIVANNSQVADTTDNIGSFLLKDLSIGEETLSIIAVDYEAQSKTINVKPDSQWIDILLNWEKRTWIHLGLENRFVQRLRLFEPYLYACTSSDGLWRKNIQSNTSNWEYLGFADPSLGHSRGVGVTDILVNPDDPKEMLLAFNPASALAHGIHKSVDGGHSWFVSDSGLGYDTSFYSHPEIFCKPPYGLFAAGFLANSNNFGDTWEVIHRIGSVNDFRYHKSYNDQLWIGSQDVFGSPILYFSRDSGISWDYHLLETITTGDDAVFAIAFDPNDPNIIYASLSKKIVKTIDGGSNWFTIMTDTNPGNIFSLVEDNSQSDRLFAAVGSITLETRDSGENWIDLESPNGSGIVSMLYNSEDKVIYIGTGTAPAPPNGVFVYKKTN